jgi:hypothetical protein
MGIETNLHIFKDNILEINEKNYLIDMVSSIKLIHAFRHIEMSLLNAHNQHL